MIQSYESGEFKKKEKIAIAFPLILTNLQPTRSASACFFSPFGNICHREQALAFSREVGYCLLGKMGNRKQVGIESLSSVNLLFLFVEVNTGD